MSAPLTNSPAHSTYEWRKRASNVEDDNKNAKRPRCQYYYILESESSLSDEGTESIHSVQGRETDYAKDTSDTDTKSEMSDDFDMKVEYEVASTSEEDNAYVDCSSSGTDDVLLAAGAVAASLCEDPNVDLWLTDGEDETDSSSYIKEADVQNFQKCSMCKTRETFRCFPLCSHCYQIRKTYYPPRPRRHRYKKQNKPQLDTSQVTTDNLRSCLNGLSQDSGMGSSQELQPLAWDKVIVPENLINKTAENMLIKPSTSTSSSSQEIFTTGRLNIYNKFTTNFPSTICENKIEKTETLKSPALVSSYQKIIALGEVNSFNSAQTAGICQKSISSIPSTSISSSQESVSEEVKLDANKPTAGNSCQSSSIDDSWALAAKEMCIMCNEKPKNGIFLHNTGGHLCCCYKCAVKFWTKSKRCAYCNRKVKNVVKAFIV